MKPLRQIIAILIILSIFYSLPACVKEEKRGDKEFLFSIDDKEYDLSSVIFEYNRMKSGSLTIDSSHSLNNSVIRQNFIVRYINEELLYLEAKKRDIRIDPSLLEAELREMKDGHTDMTFGTYLSSMMLTEATLKEKLERRFMVEALINSLVKDIRFTDEELTQYYDTHRDEFVQDAMCRMRQIVVRTREEAQNIQTQLKKGASFEELASTYSESPEKRSGGDMGFLPANSIDEYFESACKRLKTDEVSGIIESQEGYRIYKMINYLPKRQLTFEEVKNQIIVKLL
ncbi:MAG: peptidyl-prolyl cis-trans isomerase, partial [Myxococcota bacterium]